MSVTKLIEYLNDDPAIELLPPAVIDCAFIEVGDPGGEEAWPALCDNLERTIEFLTADPRKMPEEDLRQLRGLMRQTADLITFARGRRVGTLAQLAHFAFPFVQPRRPQTPGWLQGIPPTSWVYKDPPGKEGARDILKRLVADSINPLARCALGVPPKTHSEDEQALWRLFLEWLSSRYGVAPLSTPTELLGLP